MDTMNSTQANELDPIASSLVKQKQIDDMLVNYMVRNQPLFKKVAFIRKTYGLLAFWLLVSFAISIPFFRNQSGTITWLSAHSWILWLAVVVLCLQIGFYLFILACLWSGHSLIYVVYLKILRGNVPTFLWTLLYVGSFTLVLDAALAAYGFAMITYTFLYTAIAVLGVLLYTYTARVADFKQLYGYIVPVSTAVLIWFVLHCFADVYDHRLEHFISIVLSIMLGWIVVFDTQLIFGTKTERGRKYPYRPTMSSMAAYEMYFDLFVHFYLGALGLFPIGEADDPLDA